MTTRAVRGRFQGRSRSQQQRRNLSCLTPLINSP
jgi:hypothetical protein